MMNRNEARKGDACCRRIFGSFAATDSPPPSRSRSVGGRVRGRGFASIGPAIRKTCYLRLRLVKGGIFTTNRSRRLIARLQQGGMTNGRRLTDHYKIRDAFESNRQLPTLQSTIQTMNPLVR